MLRITTTYYKADPSAPWHDPIIFTDAIVKKYGQHRTLVTLLKTDTTLVIEATWDSEALYDEFMSEPTVKKKYAELAALHVQLGIQTVSKIKE